MEKLLGNYKVYSNGRVLSIKRGTFLKPVITKRGYFMVSLGRKKRINLHRLLAELFIPNPENKPFVCHKNDIKTDNRIQNLYWGTALENMLDREKNGSGINGEKHPLAKLKCEQISKIKALCKKGWSQYKVADLFGVNQSQINRIINNKAWNYV